MRAIAAVLVGLAAAVGYAPGAPPQVPKSPVVCKVGDRPAVVTVQVDPAAEFAAVTAFAPEDVLFFPGEADRSGRKVYLVQPYRPGVYRVVFWTKGETEPAVLVIDATGGPPPPPPGPDVRPEPAPEPKPKPPAPDARPLIDVPGVSVLVVYDPARENQLTAGQQSVLFGRAARDLLNERCAPGPDGKTREWRIYPSTTDVSGDRAAWRDAFRRPWASLPWVVVSNPRGSWEGPLPEKSQDFFDILKKYGGDR